MNVTIRKGGDHLHLLFLQSHELQLYNLSDSGNISITDCFLYEEAEKQSRKKSFSQKRYFVHTLKEVDQIASPTELPH